LPRLLYLKIHWNIFGIELSRVGVTTISQPGSGVSGLFSLIDFLISNFIRLFLSDIGCTLTGEYSKVRLENEGLPELRDVQYKRLLHEIIAFKRHSAGVILTFAQNIDTLCDECPKNSKHSAFTW
jgi:hypothetical protein